MKSLTFIEIDIPVCTRTYGVGACTAAIPTTGSRKCFNTVKTCQVRAAYDEAEVTLRFAKPTAYLPDEFGAFPSIAEISFTPATISLGENLGQRATLQVTFTDHPHSDAGAGFDKYRTERAYDPWKQGTFFGKFRARQPFLKGRSIRWITGLLGQDIDEMDVRNFIVESFDGPTPDGKFTLVAKDVLKLADGDRAQAPVMSNGFLVADITNVATSLTLSPSGVGNEEYPASGWATIGGKEIVSFTRTGDVVTLTARAQSSTTAQAHKAQDRVQLAIRYDAADPADIINGLLTGYAGIDQDLIPIADWQGETDNYLGRVYTALICEPVSVATLVSELIEQAALMLWWDDSEQLIRLQVLRGVGSGAALFTPDNTLQGSLTVKEQPEKRLSQVWTYFGPINPLRPLTDTDNFRSTSVVIDENAEEDYGSAAIKKIYSRWIPALGRTVADRLGTIVLGRFRDPPRRLSFDTQRYVGTDLRLGVGYRIAGRSLQDDTGAGVEVPVQITRLNSPPDRWKGEAEELLFNVPDEDLSNRLIIIDANITNVNMRAAHDSIYPLPVSGDTVTCRINPGVTVSSVTRSVPAFNVGSWPAGVNVIVRIEGAIRAHGGHGGMGGSTIAGSVGSGVAGGPGLYTRQTMQLQLPPGGVLAGGGGGGGGGGGSYGGGGGGGGSGAGVNAGNAGPGGLGSPFGDAGSVGDATTPGAGGKGYITAAWGGAGGSPGMPGANGGDGIGGGAGSFGGAGGAAGASIDGVSYVTTTITGGSQLGPTIN